MRMLARALSAVALIAACAPSVPSVPPAVPAPKPPVKEAPLRRGYARPVLVPQTMTTPYDVAWSPDGKALAVSCDEGVVVVDPEQGAARAVLPATGRPTWAPDGATLIAGSPTEITAWDVAKGAKRGSIGAAGASRVVVRPSVAAVARGGAIEVYDPVTGAKRASFPAAPPAFFQVGLGGRRMAAVSKEGAVQVWDLEAGKARAPFSVGAGVVAVDLSADETTLAAVWGDKPPKLTLWDLETGQARGSADLPAGSTRSVTWSPDGNALAVAQDTAQILVRRDSLEVRDLRTPEDKRSSDTPDVVG